jgi:hypothetical protein
MPLGLFVNDVGIDVGTELGTELGTDVGSNVSATDFPIFEIASKSKDVTHNTRCFMLKYNQILLWLSISPNNLMV